MDYIDIDQIRELTTVKRRSLLYGEWLVESEEDKYLREMAESYHVGCEAYDRTVCSLRHPETGEAIPMTPYETGLINKHSYAVRESLVREGELWG